MMEQTRYRFEYRVYTNPDRTEDGVGPWQYFPFAADDDEKARFALANFKAGKAIAESVFFKSISQES